MADKEKSKMMPKLFGVISVPSVAKLKSEIELVLKATRPPPGFILGSYLITGQLSSVEVVLRIFPATTAPILF